MTGPAKHGHFARHAPKASDSHGEGLLDRAGVLITRAVGTMVCALLFAALALVSLPDAIKGGRAALIAWIAQTFLQLVLLSIIMVGQRVQAKATDAQTAHMALGIDTALDRLDVTTAGGIADLAASLDRLANPAPHTRAPAREKETP